MPTRMASKSLATKSMTAKAPALAGVNPSPKPDEDFRAEDDHRTMMRAEEIRADTDRMAGVKRHQRKQLRMMTRMQRALGGRRASARLSR